MTITLSPELEKLVLDKVNRGEYESTDALIEEALQRLLEDDADQNEIRERVETAEREIDRGDFVEYDESNLHELARNVHQRGLKRLTVEPRTDIRE
jgi:Arc/MetJ-type ribon-helix-helix transcriptional regulator